MVGTLKKSSSCEVSSTLKFLCSYGGKILPRYPDGKLRYNGGETRLLSLDRPSISYSELMVKLGQICGYSSVSLRCQLPSEDLDALVSIKSHEDLINVLEEYDLAAEAATTQKKSCSPPLKIKAFLFPLKSIKNIINPPPVSVSSSYSSTAAAAGKYSPPTSSTTTSSPVSNQSVVRGNYNRFHYQQHLLHNQTSSSSSPMGFQATPPNSHRYYYYYPRCIPPHQGSPRQLYLVHNGNH
ncbi:hypothetical protein MKX01_035676 [Papaver californicum]|nr:hypothetical protein MKX01_035676 [Papaver californicum]